VWDTSLSKTATKLNSIIGHERDRQRKTNVLIGSENSKAVLEAFGSIMMSKYSEGYHGIMDYGDNDFIDMAENLCIDIAL
jgi:glycine hydroxymethyltransferase